MSPATSPATSAATSPPEVALPAPRLPDESTAPTPTKAFAHLRHGGRVLADRVIENLPDASWRTDVVAESVVAGVGHVFASGTPFGYLFPDLADRWPADHLPTRDPGAVVAALKALGISSVMLTDQ